MKRIIPLLISFWLGYGIGHWANLTMEAYASHLFGTDASNITSGILNAARLDPSSVTLQGNSITFGNISAATQALQAQIDVITAQGQVTDSTATLTVFGGSTFLSTSAPQSSAVWHVNKATWNVAGIDAFINKPSTCGCIHFTVYQSSAATNGISWSRITQKIEIATFTRFSNFYSTSFVVPQNQFVGVGIDTFNVNCLPGEDWGVNFHVYPNRRNQNWTQNQNWNQE